MPLTFERAFRVRQTECDAYGHVNHAQYLRYMQEAALDASAAVGYPVAWYTNANRQWLIRETDINYLRPLTYDDMVIVKTWVADFRRVRSRRAYHLRLAGSDEPVAEATTDWVYLDTARQRPVSVPPDMIAAFVPEIAAPGRADHPPAASLAQERHPFPQPPPPPPGVYISQRRVRWRDIDMAGHVNNAMYLAYLEDCSVEVAGAFGWPMARITAAGYGFFARQHRIEYKQPARLGEELAVTTWIAAVKRTSATRVYTITRPADGALVARARVVWVWVDLATGRPARFPAEFLADFAPNAATDAL